MRIPQRFTAVAVTLVLFSSSALAVSVQVTHQDSPTCDPLLVPTDMDELGFLGVFPPDEQIDANDQLTTLIACPSSANPGKVGSQVTMFNLTGRSFSDLWYVADPETRLSNVDGLVNGEEAFKIDDLGINKPLVSESINANGIFEPFETWEFIIDDYSNLLGLTANAFRSPGRVGSFSGFEPASSGSIIATPVPEPATYLMMLLGLAATVALRRV